MEKYLKLMEKMDDQTRDHCIRVGELSYKIARIYNFNAPIIFMMAGYLHDIGKICIPSEILLKRGKLSESEKDLVSCHPYYGYRMLSQRHISPDLTVPILYHHGPVIKKICFENLPIPTNTQQQIIDILVAADQFDALSQNRIYRAAYSYMDALRIMKEENGLPDNSINMVKHAIAYSDYKTG